MEPIDNRVQRVAAPRRRRRREPLAVGLAVAVIALLTACGPPPPVLALTVVATDDGRDAEPGDGVCEMTAATGDCSLRAAVDEANAWADREVRITVTPGNYQLTRVGLDDTNAEGDLDLRRATGLTVIEAPSPGFAVDVSPVGEQALDLWQGGLVLRRATVRSSIGDAIRVRGGAALVADEVALFENATGLRVDAGGALALGDSEVFENDVGVVVDGRTSIERSTIRDNDGGGGVVVGPDTEVTIDRSTIARNAATVGGGISVARTAHVSITRSTISGNQAAQGAAIHAAGPHRVDSWSTDGVILAPSVAVRATTIAASVGPTALAGVTGTYPVCIPGSGCIDLPVIGGSLIDVEDSLIDATAAACAGPETMAESSLVSDGTCRGGTNHGGGLLLEVLADNGGPTLTHLPNGSSPAVDSLPFGSGSCTSALPADQRGVARPAGGGCDLGAVER